MKKVVVTGGAGFIGSNLVEGLVKRGDRVTIIDDLSTGKESNIQPIIDEGKAEFINGSITDLILLRRVFTGIDYVFHQAAVPSVPRSIKDPETSNNVNINGTLNVLVAARDTGVKKVVYASSSSVYGDTPTLPKTEDMIPNPLSPYAVTKLTGELYCQVFNDIFNLKTACLRYFNVFGPKQDPLSEYAAVIPLFIDLILSGKPPVIYGDGEQTRDFSYVKDVVTANIQVAESDATGIFNLGTSKRITINELVNNILRLAKKINIKPIYENPRPGDIVHSLSDITKAKAAFGFNPAYSFEEGLAQTFEYFRHNI